jgi:glutathione S-transferase
VLTHPVLLSKPMPESLDITYYIAKQYPSLLPENHKDQIVELLNELHNINFFALTFGSTPTVSTDKKVAVEEKLAQARISEKYRQALENKKKMM